MKSKGPFLALCFLVPLLCLSDAYDPMDPNGNITIKWDINSIEDATYNVIVSIYNYQLYRHVESPGWRLSWTWPKDEVIWDLRGAEATEQGNCSRFRGSLPHCCDKTPVIVDLALGAPYNMQYKNCCRGGVLSSTTQDPTKFMSSFQMSVGGVLDLRKVTKAIPSNFSLGLPGYTCSNATVVAPSKVRVDSQRSIQYLMTWEVTCSYSQFRESVTPSCCVSLSTFYNSTIVSCPLCSCGCQNSPTTSECFRNGQQPDLLQLPNDDDEGTSPFVLCTQHMCPIRVHWHLKVSYKEYWRVKVTITNFSILKNYTDWNLVIQHPNLQSITQVFSFNYNPLIQYGDINDTGMFWGIKNYNDMLLQYGENGNVQTEMLLHKDPGDFTFKGGWALPRKIVFNGHDCVMPPPDMYPSLPNSSPAAPALVRHLCHGLSPLLLFVLLLFV
uniref:COBRA-like protein n=1 Tax=Elaeis guineensis var. tenera TaxID=51953 RepID=A0A6I9R2J7_ELAGV|nr:COBRA-like protein 7 [Elaeis guineensis]